MAAQKKIGLVLALDKDKEFRDALKACKDEVKAYRDSVKELDDKFKQNEGTLDDLKKKNEDLTKKQEAYAKQLDAAKAGLERANETYKKQADHLTELREKLREAEEAQEKMKEEGLEGTEAYQKQCEEVDKLRDAVAKQAANVATAEQKVNSWTREVKNAEKGLDECNTELEENVRDMQEFGNEADNAGDDLQEFAEDVEDAAEGSEKLSISLGDMVKNKIIDLAGDALRALGEKAIEAAKYVIEVGSSFEAQMDKVAAISGATGGDLERLTNKAKEMGATTKFSATESGEALEYMAMAGWKTNDMVNGLEGIMNLAAASGEDLATTSDIVTDALTAFGKTAEDSGRLADIMAAASSNANTNVSMMGETFKYAAPVAGALGYTMEDTSIAIGLMANAGIKASQAGTSLRTGLTRLAAPTAEVSDAMSQFGISITDNDGKMLTFRDLMVQLREKLGGLDEASQAAAVSTIFGKNAMSGWLAVINGSEADFEKLTAAVDGSNGAAERMAGTMQDNLTGKITILQSALEGLGIAAYEYIKGPLSAVVEGVTSIISGITDILQPQKTALETFLDDIERVNDEVERSVQHAKDTVAQGENNAAEIEAYKGILDDVLTSCEKFNYVDLGNGRYQILDATGAVVEEGFQEVDKAAGTTEDILDAWASGGLNTTGIKSSTDEAQEMIGYVADKVDTVESRLGSFAAQGIDMSGVEKGKEALVQIFDDMGNEVESFQTDISKAGDVEIDTSGVSEGTTFMITCFDDVESGVQTFKGSLENLGNGKINLSQISSEFEKVEDSVKKTYVITDEFTKAKISSMVDALGNSVKGLAEAWNAETGELTASHEELLKWFDTAKEVAMYDALDKALHELYEAWGDAAVNAAKAQAGMNEAIRQFNEENGTAYETFEELQDATGVVYGGYGKVGKAVKEAHEALVEANEGFENAENELNNTAEALEPLKEGLDATRQSTEETGISAEQAAQNLESLEEAEEDTAEATEALTEKQQGAIDKYEALFGATDEYLEKQNELTATDLAEWCEEKVTKYLEKIADEYGKLAQSVSDSMSSYVTSMQTTNEEGEISLQAMIDSMAEKRRQVEEWATNMEKLGKIAGNGFSQALYDDLLKEGPEKGAEKVQAIVNAMEAQTPEFEALSREYDAAVAMAPTAETLASYSSTGKEYEAAMAAGFEGSLIEYYDMVETGVDEAAGRANTAAESFTEAGETGGTKTKEGIEKTSSEVTAAAEGMIDSAKEASDKLTTNFYVTGQQIPQELRRGINVAKTWADQATKSMMDDMEKIVKDREPNFNKEGENLISKLKSGIEREAPNAIRSVRNMTDESIRITRAMSSDFQSAGSSASSHLADGISNASGNVTRSVQNMTQESTRIAQAMASDFYSAGGAASSNMADGISNGSGSVSNAAGSAANGAVYAVSNYSYQFSDIGYNMMIGLGNGINNGAGYVSAMAQNAAVNAYNAARAALGIASPSKKFREIGRWTMRGLADGIGEGQKSVIEKMTSALTEMKDVAFEELNEDFDSPIGAVEVSSTGVFDNLALAMDGIAEVASDSLHELSESGLDEFEELLEKTADLHKVMEMTGANARAFFENLHMGAEQALTSALAMQELDQSMTSAQGRFLDMAAVVSRLLDQMTALSVAVSGMDINPSVSVQIGNRAIDDYIARASINGMTKAQKNLMAVQGWG